MAFERIELNICPAGDMPVFHCSQYDTGRPIIIDLKNGDDVFTPTAGTTFELHCRKVDDNIVTLDTYEVDGNTLTFTSTEQLCACPGDNLCEVAIYLNELCMGTLNFMLHVEPDPLAGGLESETQIHNLTEQVEEITEQVIGDNYYDKIEVDDLLDTKADAATTYTKTEVDTALNLKADKSDTYTKTETNNLLAGKADASDTYSKAQVDSKLSLKADKATTYTKTETDTLLGYKANASQVYTMSQTDLLLADKADKSTTYTKTQVDDALALKANSADLATVATTGDYDDLLNKPTIPAAQVQSDYAQSDNTQVDYIKNKPDIDGMIADAILDIMPVASVSSAPIASFNTALAADLVECKCNVVATGGNGTPDNPNPIVGYSSANIVNTQNESIVDLFSIDSDFRGTVAFNQLVDKSKFISVTQTDYTLTPNNDGSITVETINTLTSDKFANLTANLSSSYFIVPNTHKFAMLDNNINVSGILYRNDYSGASIGLNTIKQQTQANGYIYLTIKLPSGLTPQTFTIKPQIFDLTAMFGSTIADYIYTLEQNNAGAGVAFFRSIYPADYYDYDVGTTELVGKITPTATIAFGQTVYGGVLDVTRGKLHVTHGKYTLTDVSNLSRNSDHSFYFGATPAPKATGTAYYVGVMSDKFTPGETVNQDVIFIHPNGLVRFNTANAYQSASDCFTAIGEITVVYPLATPFDIDLTPVQIRALVGENNVYSDTNGNTELKYKDTIQHYIDTKVGS